MNTETPENEINTPRSSPEAESEKPPESAAPSKSSESKPEGADPFDAAGEAETTAQAVLPRYIQLPFAEEAQHRPERNQWSGLRTPTWNVRQVNLEKTPA